MRSLPRPKSLCDVLSSTQLRRAITRASMQPGGWRATSGTSSTHSSRGLRRRLLLKTCQRRNCPPQALCAARDKSKPKRRDYPKFLVSKDTLHKISWSKSEKKEYTHKIGKEAYGFTLAAIHALAQWGPSPFTVDQIVEKAEKKAGQPVPVYQVYVAVAFLRQHGVIRRVGREGYVAVAENQAAGSRLWDELAEEASPA